MAKRPKGMRRKGNKWEVWVYVAGKQVSTRFPLDATVAQMQAWQTRHAVPTLGRGTLAHDAQLYLETVKHLPTYAERKRHVELWVAALGPERSRWGVTRADVEAVLSRWALSGHQGTGNQRARVRVGGPLSPQSLHLRLLALKGLYRVLGGPNPAAEAKLPSARPVETRAVSLERVLAVLQALARFPRKGKPTYARLLVMLTTGLPHKSLMQLTADDVDRKAMLLRVPGRGKGKGAAGRLLPLSAPALAAFDLLDEYDAWGTFSASAMHSAVARAAERAGVPTFRPYDLRHTHGALLYQLTGDLATVARALGHTSTDQTRRYAQEAFLAVDRGGQAKVGAHMERLMETLSGEVHGKMHGKQAVFPPHSQS